MAALLEVLLLIVGIFLGMCLFNLILVPLLYNLPRVIYWTVRGYVKWRTPFLYILNLIFWILVVLAVVSVGVLYFSGFARYLVRSPGLTAGLLIAVVLLFAKVLLFRSARAGINRELFNYLKAYLTGIGRTVLTTLILQK